MSIFRKPVSYYLVKPKTALPAYRDLTMPRQNWSRLDGPACERLPARSVCASSVVPSTDADVPANWPAMLRRQAT